LISYARFGFVALAAMSVYLALSGRRRGFLLSTIFSLAAAVPVAVAATMASESQQPFLGLAVGAIILAAAGLVERFMEVPAFSRAMGAITVAAATLGLTATAVLAGRSERMRAILSIRFSEGFSWSRLLPHRLDTWQGSIDSFRVRPVTGSGLGSFSQIFSEHAIAVYTKYAHNLILQTAVDTGVIGAALLLIFIGYIVALSGWRLIRKSQPLIRAFALAAIVFVAYNMFDWEWYVPALTAWFMVGAACLEGIGEDSKEETGGALTPLTENH
jgi:O-antigen ligase